jgi:PIN domain nuclease of toxin-antitoxin system
MRLLLDTHAFLWWVLDDARLSPAARDLIADPTAEILFSAVSAWEIAIKARTGRLDLPEDVPAFVHDQVRRNRFTVLPIALRHALQVHALPDHHRDPFDRLLVAQAQVEALPLVSRDTLLAPYAVELRW